MRNMKDSHFDWMGEVPCEWDILRVKDGFTQKKVKAHEKDPVVLSLARSGVKVRDLSSGEGQFAVSYYDYNPVSEDDLLLNPMDLISGDNCSISTEKGVISPAYVNLRYKRGFFPKYYHYYFKYQYWSKAFFSYGKGVSYENRWTLNSETLMKYPLLYPDPEEQVRIAGFLDAECSELDSLLTDLQSEIDLLDTYKKSVITEVVTYGLNKNAQMKASGISWMPTYPNGWKLSRLKHHGQLQNGISKGGEYFGEGYPFVSYGDVYKNITLPKEASGLIRSTLDERMRYSVKKGDAFFTRTSESIEEIGFSSVCEDSIKDAVFAGFLIRFRPNSKILNMRYAKYYFRSENLRLYYATRMMIVTRASLSQQLLGDMPLLLPPVDEQERIADYLDSTCNQIDSLITKKQEQYCILSDYKKSIIYEYVTGKKRITK